MKRTLKKGKWSEKEVKFLKKNYTSMTNRELAESLGRSLDSLERKLYRLDLKKTAEEIPIDKQVEIDEIKISEKKQRNHINKKYKYLLNEIDLLKKERSAVYRLAEKPKTFKIKPEYETDLEAIACAIFSDWHLEEQVKADTISGLNEYNLSIANKRIIKLFQEVARNYHLYKNVYKVNKLMIFLGGDFITGNIHEENLENCLLSPIDAIWEAYEKITSGIDFLLGNIDADLVIPCVSGNHPRITKTIHYSTESGNSLEYFMYRSLAKHYQNNKRVHFIVSKGYHCYIDVFDKLIRFHHGHAIRYRGGVGGITIPVNKAIAQWNKARRADLDVFCHFHQLRFPGDFICNGSVIGYNAFALRIKADFEPPKQAFFLYDKNKGVTSFTPIFVNGK
jgi:hypothetical protein